MYFNGSLDDIRIYNRSLTTDEISLLYNSGSGTEGTSSGMVTLNAPANNNISYSGSVTYNCSVNVTGGATIENVSLWTNETGVWAIRNTTTFNVTFGRQDNGMLYPTEAYTGTEKTGMVINISTLDITVNGFEQGVTSGATKGYIGTTAHGTEIGTCAFVGDECNFTSPVTLTANNNYFITTDKDGASYSAYYNNSASTLNINDYLFGG